MKQLLFLLLVSIFIAISCNNAETASADIETVRKDSSKFTTIQWLDTAIDFGSKKMGEVVKKLPKRNVDEPRDRPNSIIAVPIAIGT